MVPTAHPHPFEAQQAHVGELLARGSAEDTVATLKQENAALRKALSRAMEFQKLAYRDPLTGLRNRRYFDERLSEELGRARRTPNRGTALVMVDVEDFKVINDTLGHRAGDETLRWVGALLESSIRGLDVCCRLGGDEFVLILCDTDAGGAEHFLERFRRRLAEANTQREQAVSLSLGVSLCTESSIHPSDLIHSADDAMYQDKRRNKAARNPVG